MSRVSRVNGLTWHTRIQAFLNAQGMPSTGFRESVIAEYIGFPQQGHNIYGYLKDRPEGIWVKHCRCENQCHCAHELVQEVTELTRIVPDNYLIKWPWIWCIEIVDQSEITPIKWGRYLDLADILDYYTFAALSVWRIGRLGEILWHPLNDKISRGWVSMGSLGKECT